ncbi:unnamed protein product [Ectocarpus sp. 12 AP-2014]
MMGLSRQFLQLNVVENGSVRVNLPKLVARRMRMVKVDIKCLTPLSHKEVVVHAWTQKVEKAVQHLS